MNHATATWRQALRDVLDRGRPVEQASAGAAWRGRTSYELLAYQTVWPMSLALVGCPERRIGLRFLAAEAAWVLSGSNRLDEIAPYAPKLRELSDDGYHLYGAYGPRYVDQLPYVVDAIVKDRLTRQAVSVIWRPRPGPSRDTPCTLTLQYLVRDEKLHCQATMRSSDLMFGVPYDVHTFSMTAAHVALHLRRRGVEVELGDLYLTAGSAHVYKLDREAAERSAIEIKNGAPREIRTDELFEHVKPLDLAEFISPQHLVDHLWAIARREPREQFAASYLTETLPLTVG